MKHCFKDIDVKRYLWGINTKHYSGGCKIMKSLKRISGFVLCCLLVLGIFANTSATAATPAQIEAAITDGINWLAGQQDANGYWEDVWSGNKGGTTGLAVLKLEDRAYELGYSSPFDLAYPYSQNVEDGLAYLFSEANSIPIAVQPAGDPDTDGDGIGVYVDSGNWERTYETGIAMMAIAASRTPNRIVNSPGSPVDGWTYKQVLQDMVDYFAYGQNDAGNERGGWSYTHNDATWSDNSNSGYAVLGLAYAEAAVYGFNCTIPAFVKSELNIWIDYIQNDVDGDADDGGSGYEDPCNWVNVLKTGNLIFEMTFFGDSSGVQRVQDALDYLGRTWNDLSQDPGWGNPAFGGAPHYQAMYCIMKGLEYAGIDKVPANTDWYAEFANAIVNTQNAGGSWPQDFWGGTELATAWALLTLEKTAPPASNVKWEQPPCLDDPNCMDVDATDDDWWWSAPQALADDFNCTTTGLITDIHIWSSWLWDEPPDMDPNHVWFTLCLYSNDPCGPMGWSEPNELLWTKEFHEGEFDAEIFAEGPEAYYIPCEPLYIPDADWTCWLYSFYIDPCEAFRQEGDPCNPVVYWLALQAHIYDPDPMWQWRFGWKNSSEQWNDDAVWTVGELPDNLGGWNELLHPMTGDSVDLAFKITTCAEEVPVKPPVPHLKWSQPPIEKSPQPTILYGSSPWSGSSSLSTVNPSTGLVTIIGPFGTPNSITEIEWSPDGSTLYGTTGGGASTIHTIDPTTGAVLSTVLQIPTGAALQGLEFDASGVLLATTSFPGPPVPSDLVKVNPATGVLTTIGATGYNQIGGLAFDSGFNTLYGITSGLTVPPILLSVNPSTGVATQIAVTTMTAEASSLEFTADGRLVTAGNDGNFYEINPITGVATLIGPLVNEPKLSGLSLRPTPPVYWGWDQPSYTNDPCCEHGIGWQVVADDFRCLGSMPITSIHWWGSHYGWEDATQLPPASELPVAWRIGFWSNVPADPCIPYSRPEVLLWQIEVPTDRVDFDQVGTDEFCTIYPNDVAYQYTLYLEPNEYFWQEDFEPNTIDNIFWLSIAAVYPDLYDPLYSWGWKTRPWSWMDDAVTFSCEVLQPGMLLDPYSITPIEDPVYYESYDVAFELDTDPNYIKWEQPFTGIRHWPHYEDELSMAIATEETATKYVQEPDLDPTGMDVLAGPLSYDGVNAYEKFLADDFLCTSSGLITDIHIWASYNEDIRLTDFPWFSLVIYENVPAGTGGIPYSRPGAVLWDAYLQPTVEWIYATADESFYDPNPDEIIGFDSTVWRFDFEIDPAEAFVQEEGKIYWLGVHHSFDLNDDGIVNIIDLIMLVSVWPGGPFGWKTSLEHFEDDAVWTDVFTWMDDPHVVPSGEVWNELRYPIGHPFEGQSIDLAFEITTQEPKPDILRLVADDWRCDGNTPVTALAWWGSYIGYSYNVGHIEEIPPPMPPPVKPDYFRLNIWDDVPATVDTKYAQLPDPCGWDICLCNQVADDFNCGQTGPITDIHFWISWMDGIVGEVNNWEVEIWNDKPGAPGAGPLWTWNGVGNVTTYHDGTGPQGYFCPCAGPPYWMYPPNHFDYYKVDIDNIQDPFIQQAGGAYWLVIRGNFIIPCAGWKTSQDHWNEDAVYWDKNMLEWQELYDPCTGESIDLAFEITTGEYSHPNDIIWEYDAYDYDEVLVGYDKHPEGESNEPVFRYSVRLPKEERFCQDEPNEVYWLSVVAVYDQNAPNYDWGWTNHKHMFNDDAVEGYFDPPAGWSWYELYDQTGETEDMSFILFTIPDPNIGTCWDNVNECVAQYAPDAATAQATGLGGDSDCTGNVDFGDLAALMRSWGKTKGVDPESCDPVTGGGKYCCCTDWNHDGTINFGDLAILMATWGNIGASPSTGEQSCPICQP